MLKYISIFSKVLITAAFLLGFVTMLYHSAGIRKHIENVATGRRMQATKFLRQSKLPQNKLAAATEIPSFKVSEINCASLFDGNKNEQKKADKYHKKYQYKRKKSTNFSKAASNCTHFQQKEHFIMKPVSEEESQFSIAFSIMMYKDADMAMRLLRAIYRPQNYYCIHVDKKAPGQLHKNMAAIASCFQNVFIASHSVDVVWGNFTNLEADLICMKDLWKYTDWRYFINLTGQEFPLKTNWDLVKILKAFNGSNDVSGSIER